MARFSSSGVISFSGKVRGCGRNQIYRNVVALQRANRGKIQVRPGISGFPIDESSEGKIRNHRSDLDFPTLLMNTAIAGARDPGAMAEAMNYAVKAGRLACKSGRIPRKLYATASSPIEGRI